MKVFDIFWRWFNFLIEGIWNWFGFELQVHHWKICYLGNCLQKSKGPNFLKSILSCRTVEWRAAKYTRLSFGPQVLVGLIIYEKTLLDNGIRQISITQFDGHSIFSFLKSRFRQFNFDVSNVSIVCSVFATWDSCFPFETNR